MRAAITTLEESPFAKLLEELKIRRGHVKVHDHLFIQFLQVAAGVLGAELQLVKLCINELRQIGDEVIVHDP